MTQSEIEKRAEELYPIVMEHCNGHRGMYGMCDINYYDRQAYISGALDEKESRDKEVEELRKEIAALRGKYPQFNDAHVKELMKVDKSTLILLYNTGCIARKEQLEEICKLESIIEKMFFISCENESANEQHLLWQQFKSSNNIT